MVLVFSYTIEDAGGKKAVLELPFVPDIDINTAQINALVLDVWDVLAAACLGVLVNATCRLVVDLSTVDNTGRPDLLCDIEEKAHFSFRTLSGQPKTFSLPTIDETLFTDDGAGYYLDYGLGEVTGISALMLSGIVISGGDYLRASDMHGSPVVSEGEFGHQDWGAGKPA